MKKFILFLPIILWAFSSCKRNVVEGHGEIKNEARNVSSFSSVEIAAPLTAIITIDSTATQPSFELKGYKNVLSEIKTEVKNNTLRIYKDDIISFANDEDVTATIKLPALNGVLVKGFADVDINGPLRSDMFNLIVKGAADVNVEKLYVNILTAQLSGAGSLKMEEGTANKADYKVSGAGEIEAYGVVTNDCTAALSGAGEIEINVQQKLDARLSGAGSISYKGHPQMSSNISGIGTIHDDN